MRIGNRPEDREFLTDDTICMRHHTAIKKSKLHILYNLFSSREFSAVDMFCCLKKTPGFGMPTVYAHLNYLVDSGYATCEDKFHFDGRPGKARYYKFIVPEENWKI